MVKTIRLRIDHVNTTDLETVILRETSTDVEVKRILEFELLSRVNRGLLRFYREGERLQEIPTGTETIQGRLVYDINLPLPVGQTFIMTLHNGIVGQHANIVGTLKLEIA